MSTSGCNFMLAPMTDHYEEVIMGAVIKTDTSRVFSQTGKMGTIYRGSKEDVLDAVRACFSYAYQKEVHMTLTMTLSNGCTGDYEAANVLKETEDVLDESADAGNELTNMLKEPADAGGMLANARNIQNIHFPVDCKFALYPMGCANYMELIQNVIASAKEKGIFKEAMPYATVLHGDVQEVFQYFADMFADCEASVDHFVFEITMSVNSPTVE